MFLTQTSAISTQPIRASTIMRNVSRSPSIVLRRPQTHQQVRSFRFDLWSSYLDHNFEKECRRRHKVFKHKYVEALNRKLSWDRHLPGHPKSYGFKGFMCSAWHNHDTRPGGRWVNVDELRTPRHDPVNGRELPIKDKNSSGVARYMRIQQLRAFLNHDGTTRSERLRRIMEDLNPVGARTPSNLKSSTDDLSAGSTVYGHEGFRKRFQAKKDSHEAEYEIDPITNRKVYRNRTVPESATSTSSQITDIPTKTFKRYRSQFQNFEPPTSNPSEKALYGSQTSASQPSDPVYNGLEEYDSKVDYANGAFYDVRGCNIDYNESTQAGLRDHDEKLSRKVCQTDPNSERDGQPFTSQKPAETATRNPDDVEKAIRYYEATVTRPKGLLRAIQDYEAKRPQPTHGLFKIDEKPHPLIQAIQDFESSKLDVRDPVASGKVLDPLLKSILDYQKKLRAEKTVTERSGGEVNEQISEILTPIEEYRKSVHQAQNRRASIDDGLAEYDSKVEYSRGRHTGPRRPASEDTTEDLDLLRASDIRARSGILKNPRQESESEKSKKRAELEHAFKIAESSYNEELNAFNKVKESQRLRYGRNTTSDSQVETSAPKEDSVVQMSKTSYGKPKKLTGNFVRDFPEDFENTWENHDSGSLMPKSGSAQPNEPLVPSTTPMCSARSSSREGNPDAIRIETSLDRTVQHVPRIPSPSKAGDSDESALQGESDLTGSVSSYSTREVARVPGTQKHLESRLKSVVNTSATPNIVVLRDEGLNNTNPGDPATEISQSEIVEDALVREVRSIYEDQYGTIDSKHRQVSDSPFIKEKSSSDIQESIGTKTESLEPTLYKILAYDPTMQSVSTAETTSIVEDASNPLTPADVLLRLSNPAKFFPHFQPLQSQGYEIVSGSGDVLVFRKVRPAASAGTVATREKTVETTDEKGWGKFVNPIDGMQGTASPVATTGNFASPTGFVNHDLPRGSDPPFKSNIDVRREEPVFSGKSNWEKESKQKAKKKGKAKRVLISAVWVASLGYAAGVVAEFFKTGGVDGRGPQGF